MVFCVSLLICLLVLLRHNPDLQETKEKRFAFGRAKCLNTGMMSQFY